MTKEELKDAHDFNAELGEHSNPITPLKLV